MRLIASTSIGSDESGEAAIIRALIGRETYSVHIRLGDINTLLKFLIIREKLEDKTTTVVVVVDLCHDVTTKSPCGPQSETFCKH